MCELVSLAIIGPSAVFLYGLVLGLAVAIIALNMLASNVSAATGTRSKKFVSTGYLIRILLYALALYLCAKTGMFALIGCMAGLLLPKAALTFGQLVMPKIRRATGKEEPVTERFVVVPDPRSRLFVKTQAMVINKGGRDFLTYKHFRQYKRIEENAYESKEST